MTSKKTLYLANPYGFSLQQRAGPLGGIVAALEALGAEVWEPFARSNQIDRARPGWAYERYCQVEQNLPVLRKDSAGSETDNQ